MPKTIKTQKVRLLLVGLGNPGKEYESTYHNAGQLALIPIASALAGEIGSFSRPSKKHFSYRRIGNVVVAKPLVFMNESGIAVREIISFFKIAIKNLAIVHDDSDLSIGTFKVSDKRGSAGHRGVQSIIDELGTNSFKRVRIGIRPREEVGGRKKALSFVLRPVRKTDLEILHSVFEDLAKNVIEKL
ncbi:MAG: aminoacyl-tRNA hydrolase [Patescibacteria group bacterium]